MRSRNRHRDPPERTDRKALLSCPSCSHHSPHDGDWAVTEFATAEVHRRVYECPECWNTVLVQPVFEDGGTRHPSGQVRNRV
jgi:DNA-directed RNA polymerase subunit RPC12/RpoP